MRLDPSEFDRLPVPAAMYDAEGTLLASTPEWTKATPGSFYFLTSFGYLVVNGEEMDSRVDVLMSRLLSAIHAATFAMEPNAAMRAAVFSASLELVAGHALRKDDVGTVMDALFGAQLSIEKRVNGMEVQILCSDPEVTLRAPMLSALAMTQFAVNAHKHEGVTTVRLRVAPGPTFFVEWPSEDTSAASIDSSRHHDRRGGWGWGFVQLAADALGATAIPPAPLGDGIKGACFSVGAPRIALPLACIKNGVIRRSTTSWDQDRRLPTFGEKANTLVAQAVKEAQAAPGQIIDIDIYRARQTEDETWMCLPPETGSERIRDVLHGFSHERELFMAPPPHNLHVDALVTLLQIAALGLPWPIVPLKGWTDNFKAARDTLGLPPQIEIDVLSFPEPRLAAYLLMALEGKLVQRQDQVYIQVGNSKRQDVLSSLLGMDQEGLILINPRA